MFIDLAACYNFVWVLYWFLYGNVELSYSPGASGDLVFGWRTLNQGSTGVRARITEWKDDPSLTLRPSKSLCFSIRANSVFTYSINASKRAVLMVLDYLRVFDFKRRKRKNLHCLSRWGPSVQEKEYWGDHLTAGGGGVPEQSRERGGEGKKHFQQFCALKLKYIRFKEVQPFSKHVSRELYTSQDVLSYCSIVLICSVLQRTPAEEITFETLKNAIGMFTHFYFCVVKVLMKAHTNTGSPHLFHKTFFWFVLMCRHCSWKQRK